MFKERNILELILGVKEFPEFGKVRIGALPDLDREKPGRISVCLHNEDLIQPNSAFADGGGAECLCQSEAIDQGYVIRLNQENGWKTGLLVSIQLLTLR